MAFEKMYDLVVSIGEYEDRQGNKKKRWLTIGAMFEGERGPFIVLEPHINIGALPRGAKGDVLVSCFEPRDKEEKRPKPATGQKRDSNDYGDDIPF